MTTITTPDGPSEIINARRTESLDAPSIIRLVQPSSDALFGKVNIVNLIEKAVLAVTLSNDRNELLGHAAFLDYPNKPEVDQAKWEAWMNKSYDTKKCNAFNSLFLHYFVAKQEYSHGCAREIIRTMFNAVPDLHYCFLVVPKGVYPESSLADLFKPLNPVGGDVVPDDCVIFACYRHEHIPVLHVRPAKVEDHDDLVPIFNRQSDMLKNTYGDYFLAELIESQDDNMQCIVAEVEGTAIGFMSLNSIVNVDLLNECFELGPFHGLRKPHPEDDTTPPPDTPEPRSPQEMLRPDSAQSVKSHASRVSQFSKKSEHEPEETISIGKPPSYVSTGSNKQSNSRNGDTPRTKQKLSDNEESQSLISDNIDAQSAHSEAEERSIVQTPGTDLHEASLSMFQPPNLMFKPQKRFIPLYRGESTVFSIQLFCIDEKYEMRSCDFMAKAFELFPGYEFCAITVPHLVPEFPLLQQFVRITPRMPSTLAQELYVFSRAGLLRDFCVRPATTADYDGVANMVKTLDRNENLLSDLQLYNQARRDHDGTEIQAFVAACSGQIVGVAIVRREEDIEYIRSHYNIEDFIYFNHHRREEHGHLHHYALNPIFKHYSKAFLKEVLRLGHKSCLYYPLYPGYVNNKVVKSHTLVAALSDLVPVRSRRQILYSLDTLGINAPSARVLQQQEQYALNHINRKLTLEPKVTINARIVVIGASDVGVAFLETFAFCPHLRFNNLLLVSPHGLPGEMPPDEHRERMLSSSQCYSHEEYCQMSLRAWVNVVYGKMTAIDRKKKHVIVNYNTVVPYDHLVITTGLQYQMPAPTEADVSKMITNSELEHSPDRRFTGLPPKNVFVINDAYEAAVALYWTENNLLKSQAPVVVYGNSLDAYTCVQALMTMGIAGNMISLVQPPNQSQTTFLNNKDLEGYMLQALKDVGVEVYSDFILAQWNDGKEADVIKCVSFTSSSKPIKLQAKALFSFYKKQVDLQAFKAVNDSCLVFDGRLVIDASFHTTDVAIRAAGPITKFQRCYHADQWTHANFNSKEVGIQLASSMLSLFDPTLEPEPEPPGDLLKLIPMYRSPKIQYAFLPGGYHYLHIAKPGLPTPLDVVMAQNDYGRELITGKPEKDIGFFRLHINQYSTVETITCFSKEPFHSGNLACLYGLHERYLNNLVSRFDEQLITDFYKYFAETWALAIYHDRFPDFRDEVRELLITRPSGDIEALEEKVCRLLEDDIFVNKAQRNVLEDHYVQSGAKRAVETRLLSFLSYNYYHLPMYAKPGMV